MTNSIGEIEFNEVLFIIGSNATEAHPIIGNKMKRAATVRGAKLIVIDPRQTELAEHSTIWMQLTPGTDIALINGLIHIIITEGWADRDYIAERCEGYDEMWAVVKNYPPERASQICGVPVEQMYAAAELYAKTKKAGIFYTLGITEHITGTANVMSLANLAMVTGHMGVESAGVNPLRGQNNVQGACDMGALPNVFSGYQAVANPDLVAKFEKDWGCKLSTAKGLTIPDMLDGAASGQVKAMYIMGEDPVMTDPDANHVRKALDSLDFLVAQDLFMSESAQYADVFLPAACYAEKEGTFTNTERRVQRVRKAVEPPGQARADWEILCDLSRRMGYDMQYDSAEGIFEEVARLTPSYGGITYERIDKVGLQWPCPSLDHPGTKFLHEGTFPRGKGLLQGIDHKPAAELPDEEYPILLTTGRKLNHYNVMTRFSDSLLTLDPHEEAEINPADAAKLGLRDDDEIRVSSRRGSVVTRVKITDKIAPGVIFMTFHYKESPTNELTHAAFDPISKTGEYKVCAVRIEKHTGEEIAVAN